LKSISTENDQLEIEECSRAQVIRHSRYRATPLCIQLFGNSVEQESTGIERYKSKADSLFYVIKVFQMEKKGDNGYPITGEDQRPQCFTDTTAPGQERIEDGF